VVESPSHNDRVSGVITVRGYAYDPDGRITRVRVLVDNGIFGTLRYGVNRADACANLTDVAACPGIGFEGELDTRRMPNGPHVLRVELLDDAGYVTLIPIRTGNGLNLTFEN
jgi:hypothetical protein